MRTMVFSIGPAAVALDMLGKHISLIKDHVEMASLVGVMDETKIAKLSDADLAKLRGTLAEVKHLITGS